MKTSSQKEKGKRQILQQENWFETVKKYKIISLESTKAKNIPKKLVVSFTTEIWSSSVSLMSLLILTAH